MPYDPEEAVYKAEEHTYSINDLLRSALDPEYMINGLPRISDFHLKVGEVIRFRLDDSLHAISGGEILTQEVAEKLIYAILPQKFIDVLVSSSTADADAGYELPRENFNFRINAFRDKDGLAATIRLLPRKVPVANEVGFPSDEIWQDLIHLKRGLVIVSGIAGSGKSTTIASLIHEISGRRPIRIITLEDPIEYHFQSNRALISQREVGAHVESFPRGLRSALRENPDIIYVGEVRDQETAQLALTAAETGHLVFTTLHTRDAIGAVTRLVDMFPPEREKEICTQLSFGLASIISQKLIPRVDGNGRHVAMEIMNNASGLGNLLRNGKWAQLYSMMETKAGEGMITMEQCLLNLYEEGKITREDAILFANREEIVDRLPNPEEVKKKRR